MLKIGILHGFPLPKDTLGRNTAASIRHAAHSITAEKSSQGASTCPSVTPELEPSLLHWRVTGSEAGLGRTKNSTRKHIQFPAKGRIETPGKLQATFPNQAYPKTCLPS